MTDPVIGSDGRTYERSAITQWLRTHPNSPMTRQPMNVASLKPNYALRAAIERFSAIQTGAPKKATEPPGDYYYAIQVHNEINSIVKPQQTVQSRKRNVLLMCFLCVLLVIIIIIIASKAV